MDLSIFLSLLGIVLAVVGTIYVNKESYLGDIALSNALSNHLKALQGRISDLESKVVDMQNKTSHNEFAKKSDLEVLNLDLNDEIFAIQATMKAMAESLKSRNKKKSKKTSKKK